MRGRSSSETSPATDDVSDTENRRCDSTTYVGSSTTNNPTGAVLLPQSPKANSVFEYTGASQSSSDDTEDRVRGQAGAVPQAEVEGKRHDYRVEQNQEPENSDALFPGAQRVIERRRFVWI